ncbi:hypothetical protein FBU59_005196 [Linderina macrospora]|uniref:Uncharacterized protein n=1 Tax=Linderina macrospora TaxID=4868 RepID=A0ACC1J3I2_9FUNG|nr:hypothetical protein FBU59_005196 [Linderina macrospora]
MATKTQLAKLALFSGSVSASGNTIAQYLSQERTQTDHSPTTKSWPLIANYSPVQTLRFFAYGLTFAPVSYRWHALLNKRFPLESAGSAKAKAIVVAKRMVIDQSLFAPFATGAFVVCMGFLEGLTPTELVERAKVQYPRILVAGYMLWPAAQLINFSVIPLAYRVPFGSTVSLFWNTYLGWSNNKMSREMAAERAGSPETGAAVHTGPAVV